MNIGFDLDKIFIDYPPFVPDGLIDALYKAQSNGILRYRIPSKPEQIVRLFTHLPPFRPPLMTNIQTVKDKNHKGTDKYHLISSRFSFLRQRTEAIIKRYAFDKIFDGMFFNFEDEQPHIFKDKIVKKLKLDRYIDDDLPLLRFLASENSNTKFYWLNKNEVGQLSRNLFAITKLSDFLR